MILGFTGARKGCTAKQQHELRLRLERAVVPGSFALHGDALGADELFHYLALVVGYEVHLFPCDIANQRAYCTGATQTANPQPPLVRNRVIAHRCSVLLACPSGPEHGESGTWSTIRFARKLGTRIVILWPNGSVTKEAAKPPPTSE